MTLRVTPGEIVAAAEASGKPGLLAVAPDWGRVRLGDVACVVNGAAFSSRHFNVAGSGMPLIRIRDVKTSTVSTWYDGPWEAANLVEPGALLIGMDGDFNAATWRGPTGLLNQRVCRIDVDSERYDRRFLELTLQGYLESIWKATSSTTVKHLSSRSIADIPLPSPPLHRQRGIVGILEDHLSRLDAADAYLDAVVRRQRSLTASVLTSAIPDPDRYPRHWRRVTVADAGHLELGRQRHPDWHHGPNMHPYLRVANVFEDRIDATDIKEMHWSGDTFERFRLHPGDVLLNEGQSPEWLGRPAIYRGSPPDVAFTNSLLRFVANPDVLPDFALLVFRRHMHAGRFQRESRITTNIAHLSAGRLKAVEFPIPPIPEQERLVGEVAMRLDSVVAVVDQVKTGRARAKSLRRALLVAAFSGRLAGRASDVDLTEEMASA